MGWKWICLEGENIGLKKFSSIHIKNHSMQRRHGKRKKKREKR